MFYILITALLILLYFIIRSGWVNGHRSKLSKRGHALDKILPSYKYMLWKKFWIWDINKFYKEYVNKFYENK